MQTVKALKAFPGRLEGSVFSVDDVSAEVLKERGEVEFVDEATDSGGLFATAAGRRSGAAVTQVAAADYPEQPADVAGEPVDQDAEGDGDERTADTADGEAGAVVDGVIEVDTVTVTRASNKADLVAYAVGKVKHDDGTDLTVAELESLSKPELVAKLGL